MDEDGFNPLQLLGVVGVAIAFFVLFYIMARNRHRNRPWMWGLIGGLLYPVAIVGIFLWIYSVLKGKSILNGFACLCPKCRKEVPHPYRQQGICPVCGARFHGI